MAKFKKKKSKPTPDPEDSKTKPSPDKEIPEKKGEDLPETENTSEKGEKSKVPEISDRLKNENEHKLNKLFWLRVILAVIAGISATFLFDPIEDPEEKRWTSIGFMIVIFIITIGIAKGMKMQLPSSDRKKIVTQAIGSYIFLYLFMWIVTYTIVTVTSSDSGMSMPFP